MKSLQSVSFKAAAVIALLGGSSALATAKTYDIAEIGEYFSIAGSIVTDGKFGGLNEFGTLQQADILSWNFTITSNAGSYLNVTGPSLASQVFVTGSDLYADMFGLYFTFNDHSGPGEIEFYTRYYQTTPNGPVLTTADVKLSDAFVVGGANAPWPYMGEFSAFFQSSNCPAPQCGGLVSNEGEKVQFAIDPTPFDTSNTPLPATLPLFASGLGALGLLGWRRKKKAALS